MPKLIQAKYTDAEAGTVADAKVATHAALPTVHQNAPALIATHKADASAHHVRYADPEAEAAALANDDIADAITKKHAKNADTALGAQSANLNMNTHKVVGVVDPTTNQNAATKKYVDELNWELYQPIYTNTWKKRGHTSAIAVALDLIQDAIETGERGDLKVGVKVVGGNFIGDKTDIEFISASCFKETDDVWTTNVGIASQLSVIGVPTVCTLAWIAVDALTRKLQITLPAGYNDFHIELWYICRYSTQQIITRL